MLTFLCYHLMMDHTFSSGSGSFDTCIGIRQLCLLLCTLWASLLIVPYLAQW